MQYDVMTCNMPKYVGEAGFAKETGLAWCLAQSWERTTWLWLARGDVMSCDIM